MVWSHLIENKHLSNIYDNRIIGPFPYGPLVRDVTRDECRDLAVMLGANLKTKRVFFSKTIFIRAAYVFYNEIW